MTIVLLLLTLSLASPAIREEPPSPPAAEASFETAAPAGAEPTEELSLDCAELAPPVVLYRAAPKPPLGLRGKGRQDQVVLAARIGEDGKLGELKAVKATRDDLVPPALEAARRWRFAPARCDGQPIAVSYQLTLNFR